MDLIRRADAIEALGEKPLNWTDTPEEIQSENDWEMYKTAIEAIPAVELKYNPDEWCHDCKEYDTENHCCPRWNRVIRRTLEENKTYADGYHDGQMDERGRNKWIPCSERLPEENEAVLTQANFKNDVKIAVSSRVDYNYWTGWGTRDIDIVAWMPLPEPYMRGADNEQRT